MSRGTTSVVYATFSTIVLAFTLTILRSLLGNPIDAAQLIITVAVVWPVSLVTHLWITRNK